MADKAFFVIQHGPEIRFLDSLRDNHQYNEIILIVSQNIVDEVGTIVGSDYLVVTMPSVNKSKKYKMGMYLSMLGDSLVRRLNNSKNISSFSYSRQNINKKHKSQIIKNILLNPVLPIIINPLFYIFKFLSFYFFKDDDTIMFFNNLNGSTIILCDHLGGSDYISYNAKLAGLNVDYYLNNNKDLTIRPYAPLCADNFNIWFHCQKNFLQDICSTLEKTKEVGFTRIQYFLKQTVLNQNDKKYLNILHCCADPKRKPYEIYSIKQLCDTIKDKKLSIKLHLRVNPMDKSGIFDLLRIYDFVNVFESGWKWNSEKFINIPSKEDERIYINQIKSADIISALPSTTLVEGICFQKKVFCFVDEESLDFNYDISEINMVIPKSIQQNNNFVIIKNNQQYIKELKELKKC
jgi:hypothetical protein